ncbi:hypothetical protein BpHYR1_001418 [Brachionus plicatilis]|uniref:Uncharacterized protein n=1 Tax=Brachionus plicatilis TaxID=10195 RepID=A0A3M7RW79_BRAPC|nr:hypothetical protein BpHYR1_001418 [Brachionus plicatilis]
MTEFLNGNFYSDQFLVFTNQFNNSSTINFSDITIRIIIKSSQKIFFTVLNCLRYYFKYKVRPWSNNKKINYYSDIFFSLMSKIIFNRI